MKKFSAILLLVAGLTAAYGQIENPPTASSLGLGSNNNVSFSNIVAASLTTRGPATWALDARQTAAGTNAILALPSNANVLRLTNNNAISGVSGGVLGAFYFLINQSGTNLVISNSATITVRGGTNITLGTNQSATLIATTATNATVH